MDVQSLHAWTLTTSLNPLHLSQHPKLSAGSEKYLALHTYNTSNTGDTMAWAHDLLKMSQCQRAVKEPPCVVKQNTSQASLIALSHSPSGKTLKLAFKCQLSEAHQPYSCGPQALRTRRAGINGRTRGCPWLLSGSSLPRHALPRLHPIRWSWATAQQAAPNNLCSLDLHRSLKSGL